MPHLYYLALLSVLFLPGVTFAAPATFKDLVGEASSLLNQTVPIIMGLMLLVFFWGLAMMILKAGDTKAVEDGKKIMRAGIFGLFVAVTVWGLVSFLLVSVFGGSLESKPPIPEKRLPNW